MAALQVDLDAKSAEAVGLASKVAELNEKNCEWKMLHVKHSIPQHLYTADTHTHTHVRMHTHLHSLIHLFTYPFTHDTLSTL